MSPTRRAVAEFLAAIRAVAWVSYAGLPTSPFQALAQEISAARAGRGLHLRRQGRLRGRPEAWSSACELFSHLANIGDTRSLILHPASTTHRQLTDEQRLAAGAGPDVVRLSVGLESADDLIRDLDQALLA